jgi:hypothetical protein
MRVYNDPHSQSKSTFKCLNVANELINKMTERVHVSVTLPTCIREVLGSHLGQDIGFLLLCFSGDFPLSLQANGEIVK